MSIDVEVEEGLREFSSVVGNLKHVRIESSQMEDELSETTHGQLEGHLREEGGGRERERKKKKRKEGRDEIDHIKLIQAVAHDVYS